jgi:hypothetical protein
VNILRIISHNHLLIRLFLVCSILAVLFIGSVYSQSKNTTESDTVSQTQNTSKEFQENQTKINEQILELKKLNAELAQKVGDDKQAYYDSALNSWNLIFAVFGGIITLVVASLGFIGWKSISNIETELETKLSSFHTSTEVSVEKNESDVKENKKEIKDDLNNRFNDLLDRLKDFKSDQKERFENFEKDAKELIERGLNDDLQRVIGKLFTDVYAKRIDDISNDLSDLSNKLEKLSSDTSAKEILIGKTEVNSFDNVEDASKPKSENLFDAK